jgi:hypothetical protein
VRLYRESDPKPVIREAAAGCRGALGEILAAEGPVHTLAG